VQLKKKGGFTMKSISTFLLAMVAGALALVPGKTSAFPLLLQSISGRLTTTAYYGATADTTTNRYTVKTFNTRQIMLLITNTVGSIAPDVVLPAKIALAVDPYTYDVFLTNSEGFYFNLTASNLASFSIGEIATRFNGADKGTVETDAANVLLNIHLIHDQNFHYYEFDMVGAGKLNLSLDRNGVATMTVTVKSQFGAGVDQDSEPGLCSGEYTLKGSGVPPAGGIPYSVYWWNNLAP